MSYEMSCCLEQKLDLWDNFATNQKASLGTWKVSFEEVEGFL